MKSKNKKKKSNRKSTNKDNKKIKKKNYKRNYLEMISQYKNDNDINKNYAGKITFKNDPFEIFKNESINLIVNSIIPKEDVYTFFELDKKKYPLDPFIIVPDIENLKNIKKKEWKISYYIIK